MTRTFAALWAGTAALALAACAAGGGHGVMPSQSIALGPDMIADVTLPHDGVGEELPTEGVGTEKDPHWGTIGGFTQMHYAQVLAFPPGTTLTIHNLSKNTPHTFDVVAVTKKMPAHFPSTPPSVNARGGNQLKLGYASGPIQPGHKVTVKLVKEGTYLIECAFHYGEGMQDVLVVKAGAKPGPQGTPDSGGGSNPSPSPTSSSGSGGW